MVRRQSRFDLTGSVLALVYASSIRFTVSPRSAVSAAYARLPLSLDDSARCSAWSAARPSSAMHWPAIRRSAFAGMLLVFIDTLKELPATMTLRPFNFDTWQRKPITWSKDERLGEAAFPSLLIVLASLPAVALLARAQSSKPSRPTTKVTARLPTPTIK